MHKAVFLDGQKPRRHVAKKDSCGWNNVCSARILQGALQHANDGAHVKVNLAVVG
jgi:hypothetical protein